MSLSNVILRLARFVSIVVALPAFASEPAPLLPEASDPVLGHRAAVVEWAWSPQYAERFGLPVQEDGLDDGYLWLVGIKVVRMDFFDRPTYRCRIVGLLDNQAPIVWPPGERYVMHPSQLPMGGGLPGQGTYRREISAMPFTPGQSTWIRNERRESERMHAHSALGAPYLFMHRTYSEDLAYFELDMSCRHFGDPDHLNNRISFPAKVDAVETPTSRAYKQDALWIDLPEVLIRRVYKTSISAGDWATCLMNRSGMKNRLPLLNDERERLGKVNCEPVSTTGPQLGRRQ